MSMLTLFFLFHFYNHSSIFSECDLIEENNSEQQRPPTFWTQLFKSSSNDDYQSDMTMITEMWNLIELKKCEGPTFTTLTPIFSKSSLELISNLNITTTTVNYTSLYNQFTALQTYFEGYLLEMNCSSPSDPQKGGKGEYSYSFLSNKHTTEKYVQPVLLPPSSSTHLIEREYLKTTCSLPSLSSPLINVIPKIEPKLEIIQRSLHQQIVIASRSPPSSLSSSPPFTSPPSPSPPLRETSSSSPPDQGEEEKIAMNVVIVLLSSISNSHFERMMPRSSALLRSLRSLDTRTKYQTRIFHYDHLHIISSSPLDIHHALFSGRPPLPLHSDFFHDESLNDDVSGNHRSGGGGSHGDGGDAERGGEWLWEWYRKRGYVSGWSEGHCLLADSIRRYMQNDVPRIDHRFTELFCQIGVDPFMTSSSPSSSLFNTSFAHLHNDVENDDVNNDFKMNGDRDRDWGWKIGRSCAGNINLSDLSLEFAKQMLTSYPIFVPKFIPLVIMDGHDPSMLRIKLFDDSLFSFLQTMMIHHLHNTALVIMNDVGETKSSYAKTAKGKHEVIEGMMWMMIPDLWLLHYPQMLNSLNGNTHSRITTYDVYTTLRRLPMMTIPISSLKMFNSNDDNNDDDNHHHNVENAKLITTYSNSFGYRRLDEFIPSYSVSLVDELVEERKCSEIMVPKSMCRCRSHPHLTFNYFISFVVIFIVMNMLFTILIKFKIL